MPKLDLLSNKMKNGKGTEAEKPSVNISDSKISPLAKSEDRSEEKPKKKGFLEKLFGSRKRNVILKERIRDDIKSVDKKEMQKEGEISEELSSMEDVNLMPEELVAVPKEELGRRIFIIVLLILVTIAVVGLAYIGLTWYQLKINTQIKNMDLKIAAVNREINSYEKNKEEAITTQSKLKNINTLLGRHVYWTEFFKLLEKYTLPEVYYTNFSASLNGGIVLSASTDSYNSVARQLLALQKADDFVQEVSISSANAEMTGLEVGEKIVNFEINLQIIPDLFIKE